MKSTDLSSPSEARLPVSYTYNKPTYIAPDEHLYARGMFITINNHKQGSDTLYQSLKKQYQSIVYGLTCTNHSRNDIKCVTGKLPKRNRIMDCLVVNELPVMVAGIHNYDTYNNKTLRGSRVSSDYQHLHMYVYGVHHHLPDNSNLLDKCIEHLKILLARHNKLNKYKPSELITIAPVGRGEYIFNDVVTPSSVYEYLEHPYKNPSKVCCINYIADTIQYGNNNYPLSYIYRR